MVVSGMPRAAPRGATGFRDDLPELTGLQRGMMTWAIVLGFTLTVIAATALVVGFAVFKLVGWFL